MEFTRSKGGIDERVVDANKTRVPDLWHIAMAADEEDKAMILECWYLCRDMLRTLQEQK